MQAIANGSDERLTATRRSKFAYIYVRQSSVNQVRHHQESTSLQYNLVDRAVGLGWPRDRIHVIDEDLGKSGSGRADRQGFQKLIAEIGLGNAGLVISLDASRLARNNRDWHQLLELCSLFGVLIADGERLYDPCAYHDRLLLGLSGIMSEAELHQIRFIRASARRPPAVSFAFLCRQGSLTAGRAISSSIPIKRFKRVSVLSSANSGNCKARAPSCGTCAGTAWGCRFARSSGQLPTRWSGGRQIVRAFAPFFKIPPMPEPTSMAVAAWIRAAADREAVTGPRRCPLRTGRFASRRRTPVISAGRSSSPTSGVWLTISAAMKQDTRACRVKARLCCRGLPFAGAAADAWECAIPGQEATTLSIAAAPIATRAPVRYLGWSR